MYSIYRVPAPCRWHGVATTKHRLFGDIFYFQLFYSATRREMGRVMYCTDALFFCNINIFIEDRLSMTHRSSAHIFSYSEYQSDYLHTILLVPYSKNPVDGNTCAADMSKYLAVDMRGDIRLIDYCSESGYYHRATGSRTMCNNKRRTTERVSDPRSLRRSGQAKRLNMLPTWRGRGSGMDGCI